jgi:HK97 family phage major capsid protein
MFPKHVKETAAGTEGAGAGAGAGVDVLSRFEHLLNTKLATHSKSIDDKLAAHNKRAIDVLREGAPAVMAHDGGVSIHPNEKRGLAAADFLRVIAAAKFHTQQRGVMVTPLQIAKEWKRDATVAHIEKAIQAQDAASAGLLVPEPIMAEVTELLRAAVVIEASGAAMVPMPNGNLSLNHQETGATAQYLGEVAPITPSQPTFGRLKLSAKKLGALVPVSNDFLRYAVPQANQLIRDDLVQTLSVRKDLALIRDDGSQDTPKGLRWLAPAANVVARTLDAGNVTLETVTDDLVNAIDRLESANIRMVRPGWLMHPRTKNFLMKLRDGNGNRVYRDEMRAGTIEGLPFRTTTNIPTNLGVGGDESEIYLVDFASIIVGEAFDLEIVVSDQASFTQNGQQNGFQQDETLVRALMAHDINARFRGREITIITSVDWY